MSQTEEHRENVNAEGTSDAIRDIRDEFNNIIYDIYYNHKTKPNKGEKWSATQRDWMMSRALDLFPACQYDEESLALWVKNPLRLNWDSFDKGWKYFKLLDRSRELEHKLDNDKEENDDDIPSPNVSSAPRQSRRERYRYNPDNNDQSHNHNHNRRRSSRSPSPSRSRSRSRNKYKKTSVCICVFVFNLYLFP